MKAEQSRAPYYIKLHLGDYERDTVELSPLQDGMYFRLMRWYYSLAKPIPNDLSRIYRRVHALSVEEQQAVKYVLENFFLLDGPVWRQKRIDQEIEEYCRRSETGKEAALARWNKRNENKQTIDANAMRMQCDGNANQNQNQNHIKSSALSSKPQSGIEKARTDVAKDILAFLNEKTGRDYRPVDSNLKLIIARLKQGYTPAQCRAVIVRKRREWAEDPEMEKYLRPATLFNDTKFNQYVADVPDKQEETNEQMP